MLSRDQFNQSRGSPLHPRAVFYGKMKGLVVVDVHVEFFSLDDEMKRFVIDKWHELTGSEVWNCQVIALIKLRWYLNIEDSFGTLVPVKYYGVVLL